MASRPESEEKVKRSHRTRGQTAADVEAVVGARKVTKKRCHHCHKMIPEAASRCPECEEFIGMGWWKSHMSRISIGISIATFLSSAAAVYVAKKESDDKRDALELVKKLTGRVEAMENERAVRQVASVFVPTPQNLSVEQDVTVMNETLALVSGTSKADIENLVRQAFSLKAQNIRYQYDGKSPEKGFDSSGFIAYLLAGVRRISTEEIPIYWSGKIRNLVKPIGREDLMVGDFVFYPRGLILVYLGSNIGIGMSTPQNIFIMNLGKHSTVAGYGRWLELERIATWNGRRQPSN